MTGARALFRRMAGHCERSAIAMTRRLFFQPGGARRHCPALGVGRDGVGKLLRAAAELQGKTTHQRGEALAAIAHPEFRDELLEAAERASGGRAPFA